MRFTIVGAGAIGGITGGHLIRAGHEVIFVETAEAHLAAIRAHGLTVEGLSDFTVRPAAALRPEELRAPLGTVLCAVKTLYTRAALAPVAPLLSGDEVVLSMQNGLAYYDVVDAVGAERTLVACFNFGGHYGSPGRVVHGTRGGFHVGEIRGGVPPNQGRPSLIAIGRADSELRLELGFDDVIRGQHEVRREGDALICAGAGETGIQGAGLGLVLDDGQQGGDDLAVGGCAARRIGQLQVDGLVVFHSRAVEEPDGKRFVGFTIEKNQGAVGGGVIDSGDGGPGGSGKID